MKNSRKSLLLLRVAVLILAVVLGATQGVAPTATANDTSSSERPIVWVTDQMLSDMRQRVADGEEPYRAAWLKTKAQADAALTQTFTPYNGTDPYAYWSQRGQAQTARSLALAYHATYNAAYAAKGREILTTWAAAADPAVASGEPPMAGLVIGRMLPIFTDAYAMLWETMSAPERTSVEAWFQLMVDPILDSQETWESGSTACCAAPWLDQQYYNNHLVAHIMGLAAIGYATGDGELVDYALRGGDNPRNLERLINGTILMPEDIGSGTDGDLFKWDPTLTSGAPAAEPGEIMDRYRILELKGLHYANLTLRLLTLTAEMACNNGDDDYYEFVGSNGENLELSFDYYSEFLITHRGDARSGYYTGNEVDLNSLASYELAARHYDAPSIRQALASNERVRNDSETLGWTAVLTHGVEGITPSDPPAVPEAPTVWDFTAGNAQGWALRKATATYGSQGMVLTAPGGDPGLVSPAALGIPATKKRYLLVRMQNNTGDTSAQLFYSATSEFAAANVLGFRVTPNDAQAKDYVIDLGVVPNWKGTINQIRLDPIGTGPGSVRILKIALLDSLPLAATTAPSITGGAEIGGLLRANPGEWSDTATFAYQWYADGFPITGATASTFPVTAAQAGAAVSVLVTASNSTRHDGIESSSAVEIAEMPTWSARTIYNTGDRIVYEGRVFEAQWWTRGAIPGASAYGAWAEIGAVAACPNDVRVWTSTAIYTGGETVFHDERVWTSAWWSRGSAPKNAPYGPWIAVGSCTTP